MKWRFLPFGLFLGLGLFLLKGLSLNPRELPSVKIGKPIPLFDLPQLNTPSSFSSKALKGQWMLLNVWASWCSNCQEEQAFLTQLAETGMPIYGLNYKDNTQAAMEALTYWGNPYRVTMVDSNGQISRELGVYGAPETFLIDKNGIVRYRHVGVLNQAIWQNKFMPLMAQK